MPRNSKEKIIDNTEDLDNVKVSKSKVKKTSSASKKTEPILVDKKTTKSKKDNNIDEFKTKKDEKTSTKSAKKIASKKENTIKEDKKTTKKKAESRISSTRKARSSTKKSNDKINTVISEYYDLPYKYNKTVIKLLAQNPNTLFVYWEFSDEDRNNFLEKYGERFFYITKPVLVVHNLTENYSYEIDINDFANNWYINIDNPKCNYSVELGRKPISNTDEINNNYLFVTSSNSVEAPNDHVLFFKDNDKVYFKNIHTNKYTERVIKTFIKNSFSIYKNIDLTSEENYFDFENPSSQNPTSNVMR